MPVLFLQSPYTFLFQDVAIELSKQKIDCYAMTFNLGDRYLYRKINQINANKMIKTKLQHINSEQLEKETKIYMNNYYTQKKLKLQNKKLNLEEKKYFSAYCRGLETIIKEKKINMIVLHNDTRWQHSLAIYVAKKLDIPYYVFELGLFRPNTITMDCKGVNDNNSVPRNKEFYINVNVENIFDYTQIKSSISETQRNITLLKYLILYRVSDLLKINSLENKTIRLIDYLNRFKKTYLNKKDSNQNNTKLFGSYIFAPLQVANDSQTLVHSDYNNMIEFMNDVIKGVDKYRRKYRENIQLVFKEHPMDRGVVDYTSFYKKHKNKEWIYFLEDGNTNRLINESELVITINSTVGLEAIEKYKKVICMGRAFYCIDGISKKSNSEILYKDISDSINSNIDKGLINNFINFLKYEYSLEGNMFYYNKETIKNISSKIMENAGIKNGLR